MRATKQQRQAAQQEEADFNRFQRDRLDAVRNLLVKAGYFPDSVVAEIESEFKDAAGYSDAAVADALDREGGETIGEAQLRAMLADSLPLLCGLILARAK